MKKSDLLRALQTEITRHSFETFEERPPYLKPGERGRTTPGCPTCRKPLMTVTQFVRHLTADVLPEIINRLSTEKG